MSEFTTWPWSFERDVERYAANAISGIEVCEFKLNRHDYAPQLASIAPAGLAVSAVQTTVHSVFPDSLAPQPAQPDDRVRHIKDAIERIAPHVSAGTPFIVITGAAPGHEFARGYERCLSALDELATFAASRDVRIAFEPLNPVLFNTDTCLWGLDDALDLIRRVGHPALGLCVDTWNVFRTPDVLGTIARCGDRIFTVQVSQWQRPRRAADRRNLGEGAIDHVALLRAIRGTGYAGRYTLEIFSEESLPDSIWRSDLDAVLRTNRDVFSLLWQEMAR